MDNLNLLLKVKNKKFSQKKRFDVLQIISNFVTYRKKWPVFFKSHCKDASVVCDYCCRHGHERKDYHVNKNVRNGIKVV